MRKHRPFCLLCCTGRFAFRPSGSGSPTPVILFLLAGLNTPGLRAQDTAPTPLCPAPEIGGSALDSAFALFVEGDCARMRGIEHWQEALAWYRESLAIVERLDEPFGEAQTRAAIGLTMAGLGKPDSGLVYQLEALEMQQALADSVGQLQSLLVISETLLGMKRPQSALGYAREASALAEWVPEAEVVGMALQYVARAHRAIGRPDSALVYLRAALRTAAPAERSFGTETQLRIGVLAELARTFSELGEPDSTLVYWRRALELSRRLGDAQAEANQHLAIGFVHVRIGQPDSAEAHYRQALSLSRDAGLRVEEARAYLHLGGDAQRAGEPDSAFALYRRGLALADELEDRGLRSGLLRPLALLYRSIGQPDSAIALLAEAAAIDRGLDDREGEATSLSSLGMVLQTSGRPDSARAIYRRALELEEELPPSSLVRIALVMNLGQLDFTEGRPDSAIARNEAAIRLARTIGSRGQEARALANLANVYSALGRGDLAFARLREGLAAARAANDREAEAAALNFLAAAHYRFGSLDSAVAVVGVALAVSTEARLHKQETTALLNLAFFWQLRGAYDESLRAFRLVLLPSGSLGNPELLASAHSNLATVHMKIGQPDSALANARKALRFSREARNRDMEEKVLSQLGRIYHFGRQPPAFRIARAHYDSAAMVRSGIGRRAGVDMSRVTFAEGSVGLFENWALAWLDDPAAADEVGEASLAVAERGRAQALLFLMQRNAGSERDGKGRVEPEPLQPLEEVGRRLAESVVRSGAASLSYFFTGSELATWLIKPSGEVIVRRQPADRDSVSSLVRAYRCALDVDERTVAARLAARGGPELEPDSRGGARAGDPCDEAVAWQEIAAELGNLLVPDELLEDLPAGGEVIIVPTGPLALVPYTALPVPGADDLLGERYALRYSPSLTTLAESRSRSETPLRADIPWEQALVVGDPSMPVLRTLSGDRMEFAALPAAEAEARWLAELLGAAALTADAASEAAVKARLPHVPIVHLATHGYAYNEESMARESFVALAAGDGEDGLFTVGEIIDGPPLNAEIVALSACQTGLGNLKQAEGTVGLQRAFLAKGARSVLVSLWSVSDAATDELMRAFYAHWLQDPDTPSKPEALRRAQADVKAMAGFGHPRFWAAFQLVGGG